MGINTLTLNAVTTAFNNRKYRVIATNAYGSATSNPCTISVNSTGSQITPPTITTHPVSQTVSEGGNTNFTVSATGSQTLSYQWEYSTDGGSTWSNVS